MAKAFTAKQANEIMGKALDEIFLDVYRKYKFPRQLHEHILEQCGKKWRVKKVAYPSDEIKTEWLTHKEADALLKIFKSGENDGDS